MVFIEESETLKSEKTALIFYGISSIIMGIYAYLYCERGRGWGSASSFSPIAGMGMFAIMFVFLLLLGELFGEKGRAYFGMVMILCSVGMLMTV